MASRSNCSRASAASVLVNSRNSERGCDIPVFFDSGRDGVAELGQHVFELTEVDLRRVIDRDLGGLPVRLGGEHACECLQLGHDQGLGGHGAARAGDDASLMQSRDEENRAHGYCLFDVRDIVRTGFRSAGIGHTHEARVLAQFGQAPSIQVAHSAAQPTDLLV